jgi:hypothetical protein
MNLWFLFLEIFVPVIILEELALKFTNETIFSCLSVTILSTFLGVSLLMVSESLVSSSSEILIFSFSLLISSISSFSIFSISILSFCFFSISSLNFLNFFYKFIYTQKEFLFSFSFL